MTQVLESTDKSLKLNLIPLNFNGKDEQNG